MVRHRVGQTSFDASVNPLPDLHLLQWLLRKVRLQLLEPEVHRIVDHFYGSVPHYSRGDL